MFVLSPEFLQQHLEYTGYVQKEVSVLKEPLPVPDGTKVRIVLPKARRKMQGQKTGSLAREMFGLRLLLDARVLRNQDLNECRQQRFASLEDVVQVISQARSNQHIRVYQREQHLADYFAAHPGEEGTRRSVILSLLVDHALCVHPAQEAQLKNNLPAYTGCMFIIP